MAISFYEVPTQVGVKDPWFKKFYSVFRTTFPRNETISLWEFGYKFGEANKPKANLTTNIIIAHDGQKFLGGLVGHLVKPGRVGFIEYAFVNPKFRSSGVGSSMVRHFERTIKKRHNAIGVALETDKPKFWNNLADHDVRKAKFWEANGYKRAGLKELGGGYRSAEAATGSYHKGYVPMDLRIKLFKSAATPKDRVIGTYKALFAITKIWGTNRISPKYPRTTANIAARMIVNKPLSKVQARGVSGRMVSKETGPVRNIQFFRDYRMHAAQLRQRARRRI